ncbi:MAG: GNAT family N-acetyltransferase [Thermoplasmata archaeon]|nr:GNAT family N-acetyltransferase [Thermoplasmata archaeon]
MSLQPLPTTQFWKVEKPLENVKFNTLFARTVLENVLPGKIYADNIETPSTFLIAHPYGMSLLFGETGNAEFNKSLRNYMIDAGRRKRTEWLQVSPGEWKPVLEELLGNDLVRKDATPEQPTSAPNDLAKVMEYTRVNFKFNESKYKAFASQYEPPANEIVRTDARTFLEMQGQVIPRHFWRDTDHFLGEGVGFSLLEDGKAVSVAFCAFLYDNMLELGAETSEQYRGKGYAIHVSKALIDYCLESGFEPIWSCRLENTGSFKLALKLGFEPVLYLPYYQLPTKK